ncbi:MAG: hypothetical protein L0Z46_02700 [Nitrospiraceae bacterium]|nr:hypothetical protein [Nitrospiraceae bacterium]
MQHERYYWQMCYEHDGVWDCILSFETRAEAEFELYSSSAVWPDAFLVRQTLTRMDQVCATA